MIFIKNDECKVELAILPQDSGIQVYYAALDENENETKTIRFSTRDLEVSEMYNDAHEILKRLHEICKDYLSN